MLPSTTGAAMPMGAAAALPLTAADLMPPIQAPTAAPPVPQAAGLMAGPGGTPIGSFPSAGAPAEPPFLVEMQPDGSSVYKSKTNPPVVIAYVPAPKIPASLQPPKL